MSRFDLRDISQRLASSRDVEAVVFEFLGYLQSVRSDWRASLAFYEVSQDALVNVCTRAGSRLARREVVIPVDQLPARLVRKFFHPSAFFNAPDRRSLLSHLFQNSPHYEPDPTEAPALRPLAPPGWQSCVCLPLADREDLVAVLTITSDRKSAFPSKVIGEILPLKSLAALALAQHLHRTSTHAAPPDVPPAPALARSTESWPERLRDLDAHATALAQDNQAKAQRLEALTNEIERLDKHSTLYQQELDRVKGQLVALEEQTAQATHHLTEAYSELSTTQARATQLDRTLGFMKDVFQVLSQEHDPGEFPRTFVSWFCEHFGVERCSLMLPDASGETLRIRVQQGIDGALAQQVKVRIGQGIAGWVAHNRKPLFVRVKRDAQDVSHTNQEAYNSDSFISVPLVHNDRLAGVMNLSNKRGGEPFDDQDLDRALLAGALLAMVIGGQEMVRRVAAWS
jgi:putative methionine-R-sulfoxide reductase with GAF domain